MKNCPFYGRHFHATPDAPSPFMLIDQHGNQCAIVHIAYAPCLMEMEGKEIDWRTCEALQMISGGL